MNGVLAKPFTREGMLKSVKSHLAHLLRNPPPLDGTSNMMLSGVPYLSAPGHGMKFDTPTPPGQWSPSNMPQASPVTSGTEQGFGMLNGGGQYNMAPAQRPNYTTTLDSSSGRVSDHESPPDSKRQRLNPTHMGY
jgi:osomolarity two-component system response regulator SKN7